MSTCAMKAGWEQYRAENLDARKHAGPHAEENRKYADKAQLLCGPELRRWTGCGISHHKYFRSNFFLWHIRNQGLWFAELLQFCEHFGMNHWCKTNTQISFAENKNDRRGSFLHMLIYTNITGRYFVTFSRCYTCDIATVPILLVLLFYTTNPF